jgi:hypothetical protein
MTNEIIKVLDYLGEKFGMAIDWTQENVLPYAQDLAERFIKFNIIEDVMWLAFWALSLVAGIIVSILMVKSFQKANASKADTILIEYYNSGSIPNGGGICLTIFAIVFILGSIIGIPVMSSSIAQWIIIPEFKIAKEISYLIQTI